jgi:hypothetical protein
VLKENFNVQTSLIWNSRKTLPHGIYPDNSFDNILKIRTPQLFDGPSMNENINSSLSLKKLKDITSIYDVVLSDTLTWPLLTRQDALFLGQFTWEFYHQRTGYQLSVTRDEDSKPGWLNNLAFSMSEFAWEEMSLFKNLKRLPVLDYWNLRNKDLYEEEEILVSFSGTRSELEQRQKLNGLDYVPTVVKGLENYLQEKLQKPLGVICRPGLGIISECISAKIVPIIFEDLDPEIRFNSKILTESLGIGVRYEQIQDLTKSELFEFLTSFRRKILWPDVISSIEFTEKYIIDT